MKIVRYESINYTPAVALAVKGWLEANDAGIGEPVASIHWEQKAIVAFDGKVPVGVITWTHQPSLSAVYIEQAFVELSWRGKGFFRSMFADLVEQALVLNVGFIRLGTNPDNHEARAIYERLGGVVSAVFYSFELKPSRQT